MNAGWLGIENGKASLLWRWASPFEPEFVASGNEEVVIRWAAQWPLAEKKEDQRFNMLAGKLVGREADLAFTLRDGDGKMIGEAQVVKAYRQPPVGPAPDLSKIVWGTPWKPLEGGLAGWMPMSSAPNCWSVKDGVLSNRVKKDEKGNVIHGANLQTKRADLEDFRLETDVRVFEGSNSGIYLRGNFEIQVIDSFGKPVDCHNMGALYGRETPSVAAEKKFGEWQHVDITLYKRHVTAILNGVKILDNAPVRGVTGGALSPCVFAKGPLYLQGDHSDADYRNLVITPIVK